jgi:hypothetical protein
MEKRFVLTETQLALLLREAQAAHHGYEVMLGRSDADWAPWYAHFIAAKLPERADVQPVPAGVR